jgi:hypothetical protein
VKTISLTLRSRDDRAEKIAELKWEQGEVRIIEATRVIIPDLERLISIGLIEWVGSAGSRERRHTLPTDTLFLDRLGDYFARQSGFAIKVAERVTLDMFREFSPAPRQVRGVMYGAIYMVKGSYELAAIVRSETLAAELPANQTVSTHLWSSSEQREATYAGLTLVLRGAPNDGIRGGLNDGD